jgi:hypothetical protein
MTTTPRSLMHHRVATAFGLMWAEAMGVKEVESYEQGYMICNQIERYWLEASLDDVAMKTACSNWKDLDKSSFTLAHVATKIGDQLVELIVKHKLTYAEIFSLLADVRKFDISFHLKNERKS